MFERFTDRARQVVVLAQEEARMLNHNYIGTEHLLLALVREGHGVAAKALESLGISLEAVRQQVEEIIGRGKKAPSGHIPFTPRAKKVLELSLRESLQLGHDYIGTEHILLGLLREGEGVAAQVLVRLGADLNRVREEVVQLLARHQGAEPAVRTVRARPFPGRARLSQEDRIIGMLDDLSARLRAVEEHLGLRPPAESEQPGEDAAAEPGEAEPGQRERDDELGQAAAAEPGEAEPGQPERDDEPGDGPDVSEG
jgi:ATP-dependent Clp protease ATP-binding subunit ClpA